MTHGKIRHWAVGTFIGGLALGSLLLISAVYSQNTGRVTDGVVAIYQFQAGSGPMAYDESGVKETLHLTIQDSSAVRWVPGGGLAFDDDTVVTALKPSTKITEAIQASQALSLELWMTPPNQNPKNQAEILSLGSENTDPVLRITQGDSAKGAADQLTVELHTSDSTTLIPLSIPPGSLSKTLTHLVYTRASDGTTRLYQDGSEIALGQAAGDFTPWPKSLSLRLGNNQSNDRPWHGEVALVALFDHALTATEVAQHFATGVGTTTVPPAITLKKHPSAVKVLPGSPVPFTLTVRNDSQEDLENIVLSDPECGPLTLVPTGKAKDNSATLKPGQTRQYTCTMPALLNTQHSQATVYATTTTGALVEASASATTAAATSIERITNGQVVLYDFFEGSGTTVTDVSNVGTPLNLTINNEANVTWLPTGGLSLDTNTLITSSAAATKVITALQATNHSSVELWVKATNLTQSGPARLLTIGNDPTFQNLMVGQDGDDYQIRLLHTGKDAEAKPRRRNKHNYTFLVTLERRCRIVLL
ncbi:MAG: LamG domain-containing protein [Nitrospirae bacterium]|nr:LamG domain-containing protein [Nitrospirota bacterium]MDA1303708.1 LamG domain-containing protein [Nitrospirota bacterium]